MPGQKTNINSDYRTVVYSREELSSKQIQAATIYWDKFKKDHPKIYKILADNK